MNIPFKGCAVLLALIFSLLFAGCFAKPYKLYYPPKENTRDFSCVEVAKVLIGLTSHEVDSETPERFRRILVEEIRKKDIYKSVSPIAKENTRCLRILPYLIEYYGGDSLGKVMSKGLAGNPELEVECKFINSATGEVFATGLFKSKRNAGLFVSVEKTGFLKDDEETSLAKIVAKNIANFVKKGK